MLASISQNQFSIKKLFFGVCLKRNKSLVSPVPSFYSLFSATAAMKFTTVFELVTKKFIG